MQTVVETPTYLAIAHKLFSEAERSDIVALIAAVTRNAQRAISGFSYHGFSEE